MSSQKKGNLKTDTGRLQSEDGSKDQGDAFTSKGVQRLPETGEESEIDCFSQFSEGTKFPNILILGS